MEGIVVGVRLRLQKGEEIKHRAQDRKSSEQYEQDEKREGKRERENTSTKEKSESEARDKGRY